VKAFIASISSGIGAALVEYWLSQGWEVSGTCRNKNQVSENLDRKCSHLVYADFSSISSCEKAAAFMSRDSLKWGVLVVCPASMQPIGLFQDVKYRDWAESIELNFIGVMAFIRSMLPLRNNEEGRCPAVITWTGGGVNGAPERYSAYTVSKIASKCWPS
jgi:NAD(P)-dependent dehydrogenase (short-subunit alcohol dehydrogenase family)